MHVGFCFMNMHATSLFALLHLCISVSVCLFVSLFLCLAVCLSSVCRLSVYLFPVHPSLLEDKATQYWPDRLEEPDSWDALSRKRTLELGETSDNDVAKDDDAEAEQGRVDVEEATQRFNDEAAKGAALAAEGKSHPPGEQNALRPLGPLLASLPAEPSLLAASAAPPPMPAGAAVGDQVITSTTHKRQFMSLQRVVTGPRAASFPEISKIFGSGNKMDKLRVLKAFVQNGENLDALESSFRSSRTHSETTRTTRRLMTIRQMREAGFSECLGCIVCRSISLRT